MSDTCTIKSIDESNETNGYVIVSCNLSVSNNIYNQDFTVNAIDPVSVIASVTSQAEQYARQVDATNVAPTDTLDSLVNTVIDI